MTAFEANTVETLKPIEAPVLPEVEELVIRPVRGWIGIDWAEIMRFRELLYFLVWRDMKVRYKQTVLGVAWAILQPVFNTVLILFLDRLAKIPTDNLPPALYIYVGLLPWTFFSTGVNLAGLSLVNQAHLLTKVYFPRMFVPSAAVGAGLVDMAISFAMFALLLGYFHFVPSWQVVFLPGLIALTVLATLGLGYLLSSLTVSYRDFRYVIPFMLQGMMMLSPVIYPVNLVPHRYQWILALNPMAGIIDGFRSAILGKPWNFMTLGVSSAVTVVLFLVGMFYFRRTERRFADIA